MNLNNRIKEIYKYVEPNLVIVGVFGILGFPAYYLIWEYLFPQPYENLALRLLCCLLFLPFVFKDHLPTLLKKYKYIHFTVAVGFCLPFFFCFMMLKNDWSAVWMMSFMACIFLSILLIYDWVIILIISTLSITAAFASAFWLDGTIIYTGFDWSYSIVFMFAYIAGVVFNYRNQIENESRMLFARTFSAGIAHEMRNPLSALYTSIEVIRELLPNSQQKNEAQQYSISQEHLIRINDIISDDISIIKSGNETINLLLSSINEHKISNDSFQNHSIVRVIEHTLKTYGYKNANDKKLVSFICCKDATFFGSELLLRYVMFNLIKNALHYKDKEGFRISINLEINDDNNIIRVKDTGVGISEEHLPHVFDEFFTYGKKNNTGLGLPFCQKVIAAFKGKITCQSCYGKWTEFKISLPKHTSEKIENLKNDLLTEKSMLYVGINNSTFFSFQRHAFYTGYNLNFINVDMMHNIDKNILNTDLIVIDIDNANRNIKQFTELENQLSTVNSRVIYFYNNTIPHNLNLNRMVNFHLMDVKYHKDTFTNRVSNIFFEPITYLAETKQNDTNTSRTVMIVDDNASLRTYSGVLLEKSGYQIVYAENGLAALNYLETNLIDVILMDLDMPKMGGEEATQQIRSNTRFKLNNHVPIICYSGNLSAKEKDELIQSGMNDFLSKPSSKEHLLSIISTWA